MKVEFCTEAKLRRYYAEVYGAEAGDQIPVERLRESIYEACTELLGG